jgi:hypothetical protein
MRPTLAIAVLAWLAFALALAPAFAEEKPMASGSAPPEFMMIQTAREASFDGNILTLKAIGPSTLLFSDRPERSVGQMPYDRFVNVWSEGRDSLETDPPNAAFSALSRDGEPQLAVVELLKPKLQGDELAYEVKVLKGIVPPNARQIALFIDGGRFGRVSKQTLQNIH